MQANLLILHPADPDAAIAEEALATPLHRIGFLSETMDFLGTRHYRPGEEFLQLVIFLGCSPVVSLGEPGKTGEEFCHIGLREPAPEPIFLAGANGKAPRCPACRQPDNEWQDSFRNGESAPLSWTCRECGHTAPAQTLNWRQSAGIGRTFIMIWGIFEGEAVPSDPLMKTLEEIGHGPWRHFYFRGEDPPLTGE